MKTGLTITVDITYLELVRSYCETKNLTVSEFISRLIADWYKEKRGETASMLNCAICGTNYSSVLDRCPGCALEKIRNTELEILTVAQSKEQQEQLQNRRAIIEIQIEELNSAGRKIQQSELSIEEKTAQINILHTQINELKKQLPEQLN